MLAAILVEQNKPLVIDEVELPRKLDFGQVLVKVYYSGICGSQIGEISGVKGPDPYLPHLLGHEGSGVVMQIGPNVTMVKPDDHVVLHWRPGKGIESIPPKYKWNGKILNGGYVTTFNEYAIVSENRLTSIPNDYPLEIAPLYGCAVTTGFGVIENNAKLKMSESIVVVGAGGVGLNIIQGAKLYNADPIIAVDRFQNRLELAKKLGATHIINNSNEVDWKSKILKIVDSEGADVVIDNTGNVEVISDCYKLTKPNGRTILVGVPKKGDNVSLYTLPLHFGKILTGTHGGDGNPTLDINRYIKAESTSDIHLSSILSNKKYSLHEINFAIDSLKKGEEIGRIIIDVKG
ncbi:MAG: zinc-binding dehydrogenase [Flavobacteriaceae bacterium]|nr:zinc-binding dehydrogenase [Flavobacteriaceae bacterium]